MQEIIVYRNPMEAAVWQAMSGGQLFPIIVGVVVFFAVFLAVNSLMERFAPRKYRAWNYGNLRSYTALAIGAIAGVLTVYGMWI